MMKKYFQIVLLGLFVLFIGCSNKTESKVSVSYNTQNDGYVQAISPTYINRLSDISVSFSKEITCLESQLDNAISFVPKQSGVFTLVNENTVTFKPDTPYKPNSEIILNVDVNKLLNAQETSPVYTHPFVVTGASFDVTFNDLVLNSDETAYSLSGKVKTDIPVSKDVIAKCLVAKLGTSKVAVLLNAANDAKNLAEWEFSIPDIQIGDKAKKFKVAYKGKKLGLNRAEQKAYKGIKNFSIPAASSDFSIVNVNTSNKNAISFSFSKTLDKAQDIAEYIKFFNKDNNRISTDFTPTIRNNVLTIYNDDNFADAESITISTGVKSAGGVLLAANTNVNLSGSWELPEVRFMTSGNILPTTQGTVVPIETRNLCGVLVQAFVVYDYNINQFFQVNDYDGTNDMYRVGEPVWEKNISFDWKDSMRNRFVPVGIDVTDLVKKYPGGMIQLKVSFRKKNIKYVCTNNHADFSDLEMPENTIGGAYKPREKSYWDWSEMNYNKRQSYWTYKNDPCHPAFYTQNFNSSCVIAKNVFVSDIGLMAKLGSNGKLFVNATDIRTTEPINNLPITIYNFVGTKIGETKTDKAGRAIIENADSVFTVAANNGKQISYLKIDSGTALSTSHFETGGVIAENNVKGLIYGERGVWRPGDDIYLTFVLQDLNKSLPENIPVTFIFTDPLGHEFEKRRLTKNVNGFYPVTTRTLPDSVTGLWNAKIKIGGNEWNKTIRVESVIPNHLSVDLKIDGDYLKAGNNNFTLEGAWLYGAPTPNYKADITVSYTQSETKFDGYADYTFTNPYSNVDSSKNTFYEGYLDNNSKLTFSRPLSAGRNLPGKLKAHFISRIFEPSGAASTSSVAYEYSPYSRYVGLKLPKGDESRGMLLTDVKHTADVVLLDEKGEKIKSANLEYRIYKMDWKWWWEKDAYTSATYVGNNSYSQIANGNIEIKNGVGSFQFEVKYPSWGRYLFQVSDGYNGHITGKIVYIDWPGWAGRAQEEGSGSTAMLPLSVEKKQYKVGETAKISFASTKGERALATIEKGGNIIGQQWIETAEGTTVYELPLKQNMSPNVYVHITLLQPHMQTKNSLPIRLYGVVPVMVDNPETLLEPVITCADRFEPSSKTTISVSEKNGKPMTYTLAVVDEGLLGLTAYKSPDIRSEFYKKEASLLQNWDMYKYVMNAYSGKLETLLAIGGSEDILDNSDKNNNRFTPVVKYFGPFTIKAGEKKATTFDMPNYVGAVRAMVIAGNNGAYGKVEKSVPVVSDIMILPTVPRTLGLNENVKIPVTLFNGTDKKQNVIVSMNVSNALTLNQKQSITILANDNTVVYFDLPTDKANEGTANFTFLAVAGDLKQTARMEVPVESRGIPVTYSTDFTLKSKASTKVNVPSPGEKGSNKLKLNISTLPLVNLSNRLEYLTQYPHGCIEQITSGGFPQLYLADFVKLSSEEVDKITRNVNSVIERYPQYQNTNGSFSYWPNGGTAHTWGSCYAAHFLTEAKRHGYTVPDSIYTPLINWLAETAQNYGGYFDAGYETLQNHVYRLFVLALSGNADIGAMNRAKDSVTGDTSKLLLANAYAICGRVDTAKELMKGTKVDVPFYRNLDNVFSSSVKDQSIGLMCCMNTKNDSQAAKYAKAIAETLNTNKYLSTQETAWALFSLLPYYTLQNTDSVDFNVQCNGENIDESIYKKSAIVELKATDDASQSATVTNKSNKVLFGTLYASARSIPGTEQPKSSGLSLLVSYADQSGRSINPASLKKGDTFSITVKLINKYDKDLTNVALTLPIPTAWEFTNDRLTKENDKTSDYTYQDIRDDYIYTYLDMKYNKTSTFKFDATVAYDGSYYIPAVHAEAMYDEDISAIVPGSYVKK